MTPDGWIVCVYQISDLYLFFKLGRWSQSWVPSAQYKPLTMIKTISPIFRASYLKTYWSYIDENLRYYRGVKCLCVYQISDLYLFLTVRYRISKLGSQRAIQLTQMISSIFKAPHLKMYLSYTDETFRDYRGVDCLCVYQISELYLFFKVRYRISNLVSQRAIQPTQMIPHIFKARHLKKY